MLRPIFTIILSVLMLVLLFPAALSWCAPVPLANPGYESDLDNDGAPDGWLSFAASEPVDNDPSHAHSGSASIPISGPGYRQVFEVLPDSWYVSRAWNRGEAGGETIRHSAEASSATRFLATMQDSATVINEYARYGILARMPSAARRASFYSATSNGDWVWQDDAELYDEFLRNGSIFLDEEALPQFWDRVGSATTSTDGRLLSGSSQYFRQKFAIPPDSVFSLSLSASSGTAGAASGQAILETETLSGSLSSRYSTEISATTAEQRFTISGHWPLAGTADLYQFSPIRSATYVIETRLGSCEDTVLELRGPDDPTMKIAEDDDGGIGRASRLERFLPAGQTYYALVRPWRSDLFGTYTITVLKMNSGLSGEETIGRCSEISRSESLQKRAPHERRTTESFCYSRQAGSATTEFSISGRVVDGDGLPDSNTLVEIIETGAQTLTDENGEFAFHGLPSALTGQVRISEPGVLPSPERASFSGPTSSILLRAIRPIEIQTNGDPVQGDIEADRALASVQVVASTGSMPLFSDDYHLLAAQRDFPDFSPNGDGLRDSCSVAVRLSDTADVSITARNFAGNTLATVSEIGTRPLGVHSVSWNGGGLANGTYLIVVSASYSDGSSQQVSMPVSIDSSRVYAQPISDPLEDFLALGVWHKWFSPPDEGTAEFYRAAFSAMASQNCNCAVGETTPDHDAVVLGEAARAGIAVGPIFNDLADLLGDTGLDFLREEVALEAAEAALRGVSDSTNLLVFNVFDEPPPEIAANTHLVSRALEHLDPQHRPAVNVLWNERTVEDIYADLHPRNVFFDRYTLTFTTPVGEFTRLISAVEFCSDLAESLNLPLWLVHQGFWISNGYRYPTEAETRFMAYLSLANNANGIFYFTISDFDFGLLDELGNPKDFFQSIGDVFASVEPLSDLLLSLDRDNTPVSVSDPGYAKTLSSSLGDKYIWAINSDALSGHIIQIDLTATEPPIQVVNRLTGDSLPYRFDAGSSLVAVRVPLGPGEGALLQFIHNAITQDLRTNKQGIQPLVSRLSLSASSTLLPGFAGEVPRPDRERFSDLAIVGTHVFMAAGSDGLFLTDASGAGPLRSLPGTDPAWDIDASGDRLAVAQGSSGTALYQVESDGSLTLSGTVQGQSHMVSIYEDTLAVSDGLDGIVIWNVTTPSAPTEVATLMTPAMLHDLALTASQLFVAMNDAGLVSFALSGTERSDTLSGRFESVAAEGDRFIAAGSDGLVAGHVLPNGTVQTFWSDPLIRDGDVWLDGDRAVHAADSLTYFSNIFSASAEATCSLALQAPAESVASALGKTFLASIGRGLDIYDEATRIGPVPMVTHLSGTVRDLESREGLLFAAARNDGLVILREQSGQPPATISTLSTPDPIDAVYVSGDRAWLSSKDQGLFVTDISDPENPTLIFRDIGRSGNAADVALSGNHAFVAAQRFGLKVYGESNSATPTFLSRLAPDFSASNVEVIGTDAFFTDGLGGIVRVDVSAPDSPVALSRLDTQYAVDMTVWNGNLLVADDVTGALVIGMASDEMKVLASANIDEVIAVAADGELAALITRTSGFYLARMDTNGALTTNGPYWIGNSIPTCASLNSGTLYIGFNDGSLATVRLNLPGDLTGDGSANWQDLFAFQPFWFLTGANLRADFNHDGTTDTTDLLILINSF